MEDTRDVQAKKKGNIWEGGHYLYIQCTAPIELTTFMNSNSTTHNILYHLQKGFDGISILIIPVTYRRRAEMH